MIKYIQISILIISSLFCSCECSCDLCELYGAHKEHYCENHIDKPISGITKDDITVDAYITGPRPYFETPVDPTRPSGDIYSINYWISNNSRKEIIGLNIKCITLNHNGCVVYCKLTNRSIFGKDINVLVKPGESEICLGGRESFYSCYYSKSEDKWINNNGDSNKDPSICHITQCYIKFADGSILDMLEE